MGSLKPGVRYIYERNGDEVYARAEGETERVLVGYNLPDHYRDPLDHRNYMSSPRESQLWHDIRMAAETNSAIRDLLDKAKTLYYLSKEYDARHQERT